MAHEDRTPIVAYEFAGRIAATQDEKGHYGNVRWAKRGDDTDITLASPLGQIVAKIHDNPLGVTLVLADKREFSAESGDALTKQVLGYTVPVKGLNYWLLGRIAPGEAPIEQQRRPDGLMDKIRQNGWRIRYSDYMEVTGIELPRRIVLNRDNLEIRLVIDEWIVDAADKAVSKGGGKSSIMQGTSR